MPWTDKQKQIFARACSAAGIDDDQRRLILRQSSRSLYDRKGRAVDQPTSTSLRLNQSDYDQAMATVETYSGGQIKAKDRDGNYLFTWGYWSGQAAGETRRQRHMVDRIVNTLEAEGIFQADGSSLANWIRERVTAGRTENIDDLTKDEMLNLIEGLKAYCVRKMTAIHGPNWKPWRSCQEA